MNKYRIFISIVLLLICHVSFSQDQKIELPLLGNPVSDFSLMDQNGNNVVLSDFKGKNVMLIFPRGMVKENYWCQICHYQYADLVDVQKSLNFKEKYNLEVLFVLPYSKDSVMGWIEMFPKQMEIIDGWKHPKDSVVSEKALAWSIKAQNLLPKDISYKAGEIETPFPILIDDQQLISNGFKLYKIEKNAPQNTPAIYILDKDGVLKFKYISQDTTDRPSYEYLFHVIEKIVE